MDDGRTYLPVVPAFGVDYTAVVEGKQEFAGFILDVDQTIYQPSDVLQSSLLAGGSLHASKLNMKDPSNTSRLFGPIPVFGPNYAGPADRSARDFPVAMPRSRSRRVKSNLGRHRTLMIYKRCRALRALVV